MTDNAESAAYRVLKDGAIAFTMGILFSIIQVFPDEWITPKLKFYAVIVVSLSILATVLGKAFSADYSMNKKLRSEISLYSDVITQFIHTKYEKWLFELKEGGDVEITRCVEIENMSEKDIESYPISIVYDIYERNKENEYKPNIKMIEIDCNKTDCILNPEIYHKEKGTLHKPDGNLEGEGWTIVPINLIPNKIAKIKIVHEQHGIFNRMDIEERAGSHITTPTDFLQIIVEPPDGKKIFPMGISKIDNINVINKALDIEDISEKERVNAPVFSNNKAEWTIDKPKIGNFYWINFRIGQ